MLLIIFVNKNAQHASDCLLFFTFFFLFEMNVMLHRVNMVHETKAVSTGTRYEGAKQRKTKFPLKVQHVESKARLQAEQKWY